MISLPTIITKILVIFFFLITTIIKSYGGLEMAPPSTERLQEVKNKRDISYIWVTKDGTVLIDDKEVPIDNISDIMTIKIEDNPSLTVSLKADETTSMETITDIHSELRKACAHKIILDVRTKEDD